MKSLEFRKPDYASISKIREQVNIELLRFKNELLEQQESSAGKEYQGLFLSITKYLKSWSMNHEKLVVDHKLLSKRCFHWDESCRMAHGP